MDIPRRKTRAIERLSGRRVDRREEEARVSFVSQLQRKLVVQSAGLPRDRELASDFLCFRAGYALRRAYRIRTWFGCFLR